MRIADAWFVKIPNLRYMFSRIYFWTSAEEKSIALLCYFLLWYWNLTDLANAAYIFRKQHFVTSDVPVQVQTRSQLSWNYLNQKQHGVNAVGVVCVTLTVTSIGYYQYSFRNLSLNPTRWNRCKRSICTARNSIDLVDQLDLCAVFIGL